MENIIKIKEELECLIKTAFDFFIKNDLLESWLTEKANVEPIIGGKYELFWKPENREDNSTIGCKITGIEKHRFISFNWKGPVQFKSFMNTADPLTHVIVFFSPHKTVPDKTIVHLFHTGWRKNTEWQKARNYFEKAWSTALEGLKQKIKEKVLP
ncbi:MAG: SRPBCC domain-containing protein [Candidatus Hodarchaeota archaeon]